MATTPPIVSNEVIMEAIRIKGDMSLTDSCEVTENDIAALLPLVSADIADGVVRRQVVLISIAFIFPDASQPG